MNTHADNLHEPPERADTAAEYVLGVLDGAERRAAAERIAHDPRFARAVAAWEARLTPLIDEVAPVPPPLALWPRIRAAAGLANADRPAQPTQRPTLWQNTPFWRWLSAGAFVAAAACLAMVFLAPHPAPPPAMPLVAKLVQDDGKALFLATVDVRHGTLVVQPTSVEIPAGRVPELWLIPPGDRPHSLGILDPARANSMVVSKDLIAALGPRAIIAVTIEPPGGGPGGKPSGPIIAKGEISLL
ncbi:anti-sigma factor [Dokdonella soli]|uniref:Anti-sigma factor n=1 Tax=Dokdonella soli TaxID=529810 RepID=A0ABN1IVG8_9GAMM